MKRIRELKQSDRAQYGIIPNKFNHVGLLQSLASFALMISPREFLVFDATPVLVIHQFIPHERRELISPTPY